MVYTSVKEYLESCTSLRSRLNAINSILDALYTQSAAAASNDDIQEYWLNDGQTQIKTIYRGASNVSTAILKFERLKEIYQNKLQGRTTILMDSKNFRGA